MDAEPPPPVLFAMAIAPLAALDPSTMWIGGSILLLLLLSSAIFSGSEVALFSLDASARELLTASDDRASRRVVRLLERPRSLLVTILILNNFVNVGAAVLAAVLTHDIAEAYSWSPGLTVFLEVIALTFILLVVSEITPKLLATQDAIAFARRASIVLAPLHRLLLPVSKALAARMQSIRGRFSAPSTRISGDDLKTMAEIGELHGSIQEDERELIHSIVEFSDTMVREIMISRLDIVALPASATMDEAIQIIRTSGHSRLPLFVEHLDNILGIVYAKDLLRYMTTHERDVSIDWTRIARPPMFVPLGKNLDDLLNDFQSKKTHIALVVDEYGGTAGLVTLENVLEEIVGDIQDEHDESEDALVEPLEDGRFRCDARIDLDDLNEVVGTRIDTDSFDFETLGGLVFHAAGDIPKEGDVVEFKGLVLTVETLENHRIGLVTVDLSGAEEDLTESS